MPQDFSHQNLRGRSFKGQNLAGANFSNTDLRGANFTGANLQGVNFTDAKAGLPLRWAIFLVVLSWLLSGTSSFLFFFNAALVLLTFDSSNTSNQVAGWVALIVTIIVYIIIIRQGIGVNLAFAFAVAGVFAFAFAAAGAGAGAAAAAAAGVAAGVTAFAVAFAAAGAVAGAFAFAGAFAVAGGGALAGSGAAAFAFAGAAAFAGAGAFAFVVAGAVINSYIAWRAMKGDKKYALIRDAAVTFAAIGGTSFRNADLTDANFTSAQLKSTDFRGAKLTRTCFHKTKLLDRVRPGTSYLKYPYIRQLLATGRGQDKNFDRLDLRGINLKGTFLTDASFISTDLSEACLQDANLSRAKLVQAQLDGADFTGATLTGAIIEDWNITRHTKFHSVRCEYVFMRLVEKGDPDQNPWRKPDNWNENFSDRGFGDFIKPIVDTLDLYHNQSVDPRAIAISFKQLAENHPDAELRIAGVEVRGESEDKVLLRAKTTPYTDKSKLNAEYFEIYNQVRALTEKEVKALIAEKDGRIRSLENFVNTALKRPNFYSNTSVEKVDNMNNQPGGISQNMSGGAMYGGMQSTQADHSNQTMNTNVVSSSQQQTLTEAAAEIQALLEQLEKSYPTDTTTGKMALAMEAIAQIDSNPNLTARILSALKVGSVKAFEQFLNHPAASFVIGALEDWQTTKGI